MVLNNQNRFFFGWTNVWKHVLIQMSLIKNNQCTRYDNRTCLYRGISPYRYIVTTLRQTEAELQAFILNHSLNKFTLSAKRSTDCHQGKTCKHFAIRGELSSGTSICILRCVLKLDRRVRKIDSDSSNTFGTEETPFLDSATHRYCLMALMNISLVLKMGPAFCRMDRRSCSERTLDRSSWDLQEVEEC